MSIAISDLKLRGCATRPENDTTEQIGGAIDLTVKLEFYDVGAAVQVVSSDSGDTTQTVTITSRDASGNIVAMAPTLSGRTPVAPTGTPERLLKAVKSATCAGVVAVEAAVAERAGTAAAGGAASLTLDAGASASNDYYNGMVCRITAGTNQYGINQVIDYDGTTKVCTMAFPWDTPTDGTSQFRLAKGMVFDKSPDEIMTVTRLFYNASAPAPGAANIKVYDKFFIKNTHESLDLTTAQVLEALDPSGLVAFALAATLDDTGTNGAGNTRLVAPAGLTFNSTTKAEANSGSLTHGAAQGVWVELTLANGAAALKTTWSPEQQGNTT